ncbi:ABC transporter ATP-binding protein [Clostridium sp.]|uniref:ABC transporter ATP-binding protein n=1 Tax=Clostridium sp. TaxID=1506 RepID=UPI002FDE39BF
MNEDNNSQLSISNLSFEYKKKIKVLNNISIALGKGELVVIAGPNGCGKTTLMKLIFDLLEIQEGKIKINGLDSKKIESKKDAMYLPSDNVLPDFLTGNEYVRLMCKMYDFQYDKTLLKKLIGYYSLEKHIDSLIESYSHGMVKKIQLIAAFLIQPNLIIIDETLNGIDLEAKEVSKILIKKIVKKGKTVLMCTHDLELAEEIGERAILMYKGEVHKDIIINDIKNKTNLTSIFKKIINFEDSAYEI